MQLSFRLDKRPGESHLALDGKKKTLGEKNLPNSSLLEKDPPISLSSDIINCVDTV
jgi:hypothetical protein